jgi:DNA-directed RNA polymerase specialized sigma24 family protein
MVVTLNKARSRARNENTLSRGRDFKRLELSDLAMHEIDSLVDDPAMVALFKDECKTMLDMIDRKEVKLVALLRVEGYTNEEIAQRLGCTRRSVQRRLNLIRNVWSRENANVGHSS